MVSSAPDAQTVLPEFLRFITGGCLCSYNAAFDLGFLYNEIRLCGLKPLADLLAADILRMARKFLPGLERYALCFIADKLGIKANQEHRAFSDVQMTYEVFTKLLEIMRHKGIADFSTFYALCGMNPASAVDMTNQKVSRIQEALGLGVKLKIKYLSSNASVSERQVVPKEMRRENNRLYLIGHCCLRNEERTFRIDGILHLEIV
jgi:DNA polymerase III alpha subunit (gram-positive type)